VPKGQAYDIPLRCLLPSGSDRVVVAGRCISGSHVSNQLHTRNTTPEQR
jgi:hypothetical protein